MNTINECLLDDIVKVLNDDGFHFKRRVLNERQLTELTASIEAVQAEASMRKRGTGALAMRHLLKEVPAVRELANDPVLLDLVRPILGPSAFAVRAVLLDKSFGADWHLNWHQDTNIAVKKRIDVPGFGSWSVKSGILHVQPPTEILARMVTVRIHLDDCPEHDGALRVIPGTHYAGIISPKRIDEFKAKNAITICAAKGGDAVVLRPLLLHCTAQTEIPEQRRIVHIEFAGDLLPDGLEWAIA